MRWLSLRQWRPRELLGAWIAYWIVLAIVTLSPAVAAIWRVSQAGGEHGDVSFSFTNFTLSLVVKLAGRTTYTGTTTLMTIALLVAGPPLILWLLWAMRRPEPERVVEPR